MSRYIDADALIDRLDYCVKEGMGSTIAYTFKHMADEAPSIEIVRCKECKWHGMNNCPMWEGMITEEYMFCSYGERNSSEIPNSSERSE